MRYTGILLFLCIAFLGCKNEKKDKNNVLEGNKALVVVKKIAQANGLANFEEINRLRYTFNVKVNDSLMTSRSWEWHPKTHEVRFTENDTTIAYNHKTEAKNHIKIDQKFINDQYWLLFPFHLVWDKMQATYDSSSVAPMTGKSMQQLSVTYPQNAGYTPGDVYEVYFNDDYIIQEWVYKPAGNEEKALVASWEDYKTLNGIKFSTNHLNKNGTFQIFFTNIDVE